MKNAKVFPVYLASSLNGGNSARAFVDTSPDDRMGVAKILFGSLVKMGRDNFSRKNIESNSTTTTTAKQNHQ